MQSSCKPRSMVLAILLAGSTAVSLASNASFAQGPNRSGAAFPVARERFQLANQGQNLQSELWRNSVIAQDNGDTGFRKRRPNGGTGDGTFEDGALVRRKNKDAGADDQNQNGGNNGAQNTPPDSPMGGIRRRGGPRPQAPGADDNAGGDRPPGAPFGGRANGGMGRFPGGPNGGAFGGNRPGGRGFGGSPLGQKLDFSSLGLSDDQKQRIRQFHEANGQKMKDLRKDIATRQQAFKDMMFDPSASDDQIRAKRKEVWHLRGQMEESQVNDFLGIRAMLTPDQRQRLSELKPGRQVAGNLPPQSGSPPADDNAQAANPQSAVQGKVLGGGRRRRAMDNPQSMPGPDNN